MAACINRSAGEYQALQKMSGLPQDTLDFWCQYFLTKYDRFPELDELPGVNSESHLLNALNAKKTKTLTIVNTSDVLELSGKETIEEATIALNNLYKDLEITLINIGDQSLVEIKHRPTLFNGRTTEYEDNYTPGEVNGRIALVEMLSKMRKLYGININLITSSELDNNFPPETKNAKAFVFNGEVFINTDYAEIDAPIHELLHIFLGGMRFTNPTQYMDLISKMEGHVDLHDYMIQYGNRTQNDLLEEVFVSEFAKYICGYNSVFDNYSETDINKILYNISRNIDSALMGEKSVQNIDNYLRNTLLELSWKTKSEMVNQSSITPIDLASIHRKTANIKSKLLENGDLEQKCE